jgi:hypothetical protein
MDFVHLCVTALIITYVNKGKPSVAKHHIVKFYVGINTAILLSLEILALDEDK